MKLRQVSRLNSRKGFRELQKYNKGILYRNNYILQAQIIGILTGLVWQYWIPGGH